MEKEAWKDCNTREVVHKILNEYEDSPYEFIWWHSSKEKEITYNSLKSIEPDDLYEILINLNLTQDFH